MRIGIDASRALAAQATGIENYSLQMVRHLIALDAANSEGGAGHEFILYTREEPERGLLPEQGRFSVRAMPFPRLWTHVRLSWEMVRQPPDVLFVPGHVIPLLHPRASVVTIHDLGHLYYPDAYPRNTLRYLKWATRHNVDSAGHILADSHATRRDIVEKLGAPEQKVTVVYPGVNPLFLRPPEKIDTVGVLRQYGIQGPYILYVGTLQPRKNVERLIEAFALARQSGRIQERLVLAGRLGWLPDGILRTLGETGESVTLAGYVPEQHLPVLYGGATLFVLPSFFEGFGMPVLEAMACGTPVLAADSSSLPEVVGDAGVLFDPHSTSDLAEALVWLCSHPGFREQLRTKGLERARQFTWTSAARQTIEVLERAGGGSRRP